jgi:hypothetical protein
LASPSLATGPTIADVATSCAAALGSPGFVDRLGLGDAQHAVICLLDGVGLRQMRDHSGHAPTMSGLSNVEMTSVFPSTTPTALASMGTGLMPGMHGLLGAAFWLPESEAILAPLNWQGDPLPQAVQPEPTVFERVERLGVTVTTVAPERYRESGLTRAALRGGSYHPADDAATRVHGVTQAATGATPTLTYVYWREVDRLGHGHGVGSTKWRGALERADDLVAALMSALPPRGVMVVTSDHGMINCTSRIDLDADPDLAADVRCLAGEPRARHVYAAPGRSGDVARRWAQRLGEQATVLTRDEVLAAALLGPVDEVLVDRVGDVVAIASHGVLLESSVDRRVSSLIGQHGGLTQDELQIPCLIVRS